MKIKFERCFWQNGYNRGEPFPMNMGRFGGGWNWKAGVAIGSNTVIFDFFVGSLRFTRDKKKA